MDAYYEEGNLNQFEVSRSLPPWGSFLVGGIITFLLVYIGVARPLAKELARLRQHVMTMEESVWKVAGQQGGIEDATSLLASLHKQQQTLSGARVSIQELQELQRQLLAEARQTQDAMSAVAELAALKDTLLANSDRADQAADVVATSELICERLASSVDTTFDALEASNKLLELKRTVMHEASDADEANAALDSLVEIKDTIQVETEDCNLAHDRMVDLLQLKDRVVNHTSDLAAAVETLELSTDLSAQLHQAVAAFEDIRHWMVEIVANQSLLDKAKLALQPITELGNLRHLDPARLREVARSVSKKYDSRLAKRDPVADYDFEISGASSSLDSIEVDHNYWQTSPSLGDTEVLETFSTE